MKLNWTKIDYRQWSADIENGGMIILEQTHCLLNLYYVEFYFDEYRIEKRFESSSPSSARRMVVSILKRLNKRLEGML